MKGLMILCLSILCVSCVLAETTFFEGDLGYGDDFIMGVIEGEVVEPEAVELLTITTVGSGGYFQREEYNESLVCAICLDSLREHISAKRDIDYSENEFEILMEEINQVLEVNLSLSQVAYVIGNFEDECDAPIPLLSAATGGRFRDLISPVVLFAGITVLIFFILIYLLFRRLGKIKLSNVQKRRRKNK